MIFMLFTLQLGRNKRMMWEQTREVKKQEAGNQGEFFRCVGSRVRVRMGTLSLLEGNSNNGIRSGAVIAFGYFRLGEYVF